MRDLQRFAEGVIRNGVKYRTGMNARPFRNVLTRNRVCRVLIDASLCGSKVKFLASHLMASHSSGGLANVAIAVCGFFSSGGLTNQPRAPFEIIRRRMSGCSFTLAAEHVAGGRSWCPTNAPHKLLPHQRCRRLVVSAQRSADRWPKLRDTALGAGAAALLVLGTCSLTGDSLCRTNFGGFAQCQR